MEFRILGPLEVANEHGTVQLGGVRQRAVLVHLLLRANRVVAADALVDELWGEEPPETARNTLQTYVYRLRGLLGPDRIETRPPGYVLHTKDGEVDAERFEALARDARADLVDDPSSAASSLADALGLWRGAPLADLSEEASLAGEIARLEELRVLALEDKVDAELAIGRHAAIVGDLEALTKRYPLRERLWGDLMLALYRSGRQGEALEAYQHAREMLAEELGIDPSRRLQRLHDRMLAQDPELSASRPIPVVQRPPSVPGELTSESRLAGYRIEDLLGRGGMSTVYLAEDTRLRRRVALKVLAPQLGLDERFRERFVRESQVAAAMEHPNIVPIYEAGEADGRLFIAMRYVRGTDLRQLLTREGRLDAGRAVRILRDVASALDAAHAEGLVHRDVKPANILLVEGAGEDGRDVVYLSDFGLTKRLEGESGGLTKTGQFVGTIDYVAPEQIEGKEVDARADVYSLACVLFECLTGQVPFGREEQVAALYAHLQDKPPTVSSHRPDLPEGLDRILAKALAKAPSQRFSTCGELVAAARTELGPAAAGAGPPEGRFPRKGFLVAAASLVVAAGAIGFALAGNAPPRDRSRDTGSSFEAIPTQAPSFRTVDRPLSSDDERLLTYIPEELSGDCVPFALHGGAVGAVVCTTPDEEVLYELFADRDAMNAALQQNANIQGATTGECASDRIAIASYSVGGLPAGRVLCYRNRTGFFTPTARSDIEWTDERLLVYAHAVRTDGGDLSLYEWWVKAAGPVIPTAGPGAVAKDLPADVSRPPDGSYLMSLTDRQAERSGLSSISGIKGVIAGTTDWEGTWAIRVADGEYELAHDGEPVESGSFVLQKPETIVFTATGGPCLFETGSPEATAYGWSGSGSAITWELGRKGGCAGPQPLTGRSWSRAPRGLLVLGTNGDLYTMDGAGLDRSPIVVADLPASAFLNQPVWSPDGSRIAFAGETDAGYDLYVIQPDGTGLRQVTDMAGQELDPAWSPDGSKLAFHHDPGGFTFERSSLHVVNVDGSGLDTLVEHQGYVGRPAWSPDGTTIALNINRAIYVVGADGSNLTMVYPVAENTNALTWTPDGKRIVFAGDGPDGETLLSMRPDGTDVRPILDRLPAPVRFPVLSGTPDGRWVALAEDWGIGLFSGPLDEDPVYVVSSDGTEIFTIAVDMYEPSWRPGS
jgi:serine/threonine-protein kinase